MKNDKYDTKGQTLVRRENDRVQAMDETWELALAFVDEDCAKLAAAILEACLLGDHPSAQKLRRSYTLRNLHIFVRDCVCPELERNQSCRKSLLYSKNGAVAKVRVSKRTDEPKVGRKRKQASEPSGRSSSGRSKA
jgi:hypothetical protein